MVAVVAAAGLDQVGALTWAGAAVTLVIPVLIDVVGSGLR